MSARSAKVPEIAPFRQLRRAKRKSILGSVLSHVW